MANNVAVSITADVADLQVKRALMSSELKAATKDLNDFAKQARQGGMTEELRAGMVQAAEAAGKARAQIAAVDAEVRKLGEDSKEGGLFAGLKEGLESIKGGAESISGFREAIAGVGEALLAAFAVERLTEWARQMGEAGEKTEHTAQILGTSVGAVQQLNAAFVLMGVDADKGLLGIEKLDKSFALARQGSAEQVAAFKALGVSTNQNLDQMQKLSAVMDGFARQADGPAKVAEAMQLFGKAGAALIPFLDLGSAGLAKLIELTEQYGVKNDDAAKKAALLGEAFNENKVAMIGAGNVLAQEFAPALTVTVQAVNNLIASWVRSYKAGGDVKTILDFLDFTLKNLVAVVADLGIVFDEVFQAIKVVVDTFRDDWRLVVDVVEGEAQQVGDRFVELGHVLYDALSHNVVAAARDMKASEDQMAADARATAAKVNADLAAIGKDAAPDWAKMKGDASAYMKFLDDLGRGRPKAPEIESTGEGREGDGDGGKAKKAPQADAIQQAREIFAQQEAAHADYIRDATADELAFWQKVIAGEEGVTLNKKEQVEARTQIARLERELEVRGIQQTIDEAQDASKRKIEAINTELEATKKAIQQKIAAEEDAAKAGKVDPGTAQTAVLALIAQEEQAEIAAARAIEAARIAADEVIKASNAATSTAFIKASQDEFAAASEYVKAEVAANATANQQKLTADEKHANQVEALARKQAESWRTANSEILSAEKELVSGILGGRESLGAIIEGIALRTAEKEITADIGYWTERRLLEAEGATATEAKEQGVLRLHLLTQTRKTADVAASQAAQTGATATGVAARTSAEAAGAATSKAITSTLNQQQIMADAGKAASGAYAAVAGIPIIGPVLAPVAAATAYAGVLAFENLASLDTGTNVVPADMVAQIHAGERIIPAADNRDLMAAVAGGGGGGGGHTFSFGDFNVHGGPSGMSAGDFKKALSDHATHVANAVHSAVRGGWRSTAASPFKAA